MSRIAWPLRGAQRRRGISTYLARGQATLIVISKALAQARQHRVARHQATHIAQRGTRSVWWRVRTARSWRSIRRGRARSARRENVAASVSKQAAYRLYRASRCMAAGMLA